MKKESKKRFSAAIAVLMIAIIACTTVQGIAVKEYNEHLYTTVGPDTDSPVYMTFGNRGDNTSTWVKDDFMLNGVVTPMIGATVDGVLVNNSDNSLSSWTMRYDVTQDCFVNQAWNGTMEIHQYVGTERETVQTLSLQKYDFSEIELDYLFDGNLYIPLTPGDYFIYHPSEKFKEIELESGEEVTIGMIFYCENELDLSTYQIDYRYHMDYTEGTLFNVLIVLVVAWALAVGSYYLSLYVYHKAQTELELKMSGISCMSDLYALAYMADLTNDTLTPVIEDAQTAAQRDKDADANEQLRSLFSADASEAYREVLTDFIDLTTVAERMLDRGSITFEYISQSYGWCQVRFIAMERQPNQPLERTLFTVQIIDEEKREMKEIQRRVEKAEFESRAKSAFLANVSHEIRTPINTVLGLDAMILRESREDTIRAYAKDIKSAGHMLLGLINEILDSSKLESGKMELVCAEYSLKNLIDEVRSITNAKMTAKALAYHIEVDQTLPDKLYGDDVRLKQVFINLLVNAAKYTEKGSVTLSVTGHRTDNETVRLLISVKDTGMGIREEDFFKLSQRFARLDERKNRNIEGTGIGINLVTGLLRLMDSELKVESVYGEGSNFYFEVAQRIVDDAPIGLVDWTGPLAADEDEDYAVSFKAPNAQVLVVDDNEMNLMVFSNLLKETELPIDTASSGAQALERTREKHYDIIFMDHMMPGMDGIETLHAIKAQPDGLNQDTPQIILTANAVVGAKEDFLRQGFTDYISKPIQPELLEAKIMEVLPEGRYEKCSSTRTAPDKELIEIDGIDAAYAMEHIGSKDGVMKAIKQFVTVADAETAELMSYYDTLRSAPDSESALSSFRIKIHAMKTSAGLVGSLMVYGAAAQLEYAARDGNVQEVLDIAPYFVPFWNALRDTLSRFLASQEPAGERKDVIERGTLESLIRQLQTSMNAYDVKTADNIIAQLEKYASAPELTDALPKLKLAVANLDALQCEELCEEVLK